MNYQKGRDQNKEKPSNLTFKKEWITQGATNEMNDFCDELGRNLKINDVSNSQLRNIYGEIMRIKQKGFKKEISSFYLLKPKVAYNASRITKRNQKDSFTKYFIKNFFNPAMNAVDITNDKTFTNFQKMFEAVIAYHKFHGAK